MRAVSLAVGDRARHAERNFDATNRIISRANGRPCIRFTAPTV